MRMVSTGWMLAVSFLAMLLLFPGELYSQEGAKLRDKVKQFHEANQQRTGILVPLYLYPADIHTNATFNRLMDLKRRYETVPIWVIVNPASGPGTTVEANYTKAIDRLLGAGCVVVGYVRTDYGKRTEAEVRQDIDSWRKMHPRTQGIFFDEMNYEDTDEKVKHQLALTAYANEKGFWPTIANPGTGTPGRYFASDVTDVIVVHEGSEWPEEKTLHGDFFGGYSDYPPSTRCVLVHSMKKIDPAKVKMIRKYARWIYVTEDPYKVGDPKADNPWDSLSTHMETLCELLAKP